MKNCKSILFLCAILINLQLRSAEAPPLPPKNTMQPAATYLGTLPLELKDEIVQYALYQGEVLNIPAFAKKIIAFGHLISSEKLLKIFNALPTHAAALYLAQELTDLPTTQNKIIQDWLANVNQQLHNNDALLVAETAGNVEKIKRLLQDKNINLNVKRNLTGKTVLVYALDSGHNQIVLQLLQAGANPNIPDQYDETVLMKAARANDVEVVTMLLAAGANPHLKDKYDRTALAIATLSGNFDIVTLLLKAGADPFLKNRFGESPYDLARKTNKKEIVKLFDQWSAEHKAK